ncbi:MAG: hypothetical protein LUD79_09870 [Oscillospiraceae bacterium]|nr:hypothetical protein [Oscillospiraceae bacterium]
MSDIQNVLDSVQVVEEPKIPFPQTDKFVHAFNKALRLYFRRGVMPPMNDIVSVMKESGLYRVNSDETFRRRASSIKGWLNWIVSLINE